MFCKSCGKEIPEGQELCEECAAKEAETVVETKTVENSTSTNEIPAQEHGRDLRPYGRTDHRRDCPGLLRGARTCAYYVDPDPGSFQRLHRYAETEYVPVFAYDSDRRCRPAL